jgi:hypothetical protein
MATSNYMAALAQRRSLPAQARRQQLANRIDDRYVAYGRGHR